MLFEELKTERLVLRKLTPETYRYIYENYSDEQVMNFLALKSSHELNKEKDKYTQGLSTYNRSFVNFKLFDNETSHHVGNCGFHTWYTEHFRAEIGYDMIDESVRRKGLMSEALQIVIDYGFNTMNLHRIEALVGPGNIPSLKLMDKFGFRREGHMRQHYHKNGEIHDSIIFSLLRSEYE